MDSSEFSTAVERIRNKLLLSHVVGQDVQLKKKGREFVGCCPFHNEKTGSFFVNDDKGTYYCFGCGAFGDIFEYVMKKRGLQFMQAVEMLADIAGIKLPEKREHGDGCSTQRKVLQKAAEFFKANLDDRSKRYCASRGIDQQIIEKFSIGFAPQNSDLLLDYLKESGFGLQDIIKSGLFLSSKNRQVCYFKNRLTFPIFDKKGWPIAFGGRSIQGSQTPKYLNSPETELFQKKETLYAYNIAVKNASKDLPFIIVEGYIDTVMMHKHGFNTAIASMGTAISAEHLLVIWKHSNEPIICLDGDQAGYNAMAKIAFLAMKYLQPGKSLRFCMIPEGNDPDSYINKYGRDEMQKRLEDSIYLVDFIWEYFLNQFNTLLHKTPEKIAEWKINTITCINEIQNIDIKKLYRSEIESKIYATLRSPKSPFSKKKNIVQNPVIDKKEKILLREATLLYILVVRPSVVSSVIEELTAVEFSNCSFRKLRDYVVNKSESADFLEREIQEEVAMAMTVASRSCDVSNMDDSEVLNFWKGIFEFGFSQKIHDMDILSAKKDCNDDMNDSTWNRLKALKIDSINRKKKPKIN
ncbi:MAG: DNA primase [Holosporales bacterium]|jgi:DNA primase|nr:DNA primase [Holosporales bacterium]